MEEASPSLLVEKGFFLYPAACMLRVALLAKPSSSSWMCEFLWLGKLVLWQSKPGSRAGQMLQI